MASSLEQRGYISLKQRSRFCYARVAKHLTVSEPSQTSRAKDRTGSPWPWLPIRPSLCGERSPNRCEPALLSISFLRQSNGGRPIFRPCACSGSSRLLLGRQSACVRTPPLLFHTDRVHRRSTP